MITTNLKGTFLKDNISCELISGTFENRDIKIEYLNSETGEVLQCLASELDDSTAMVICIQFEKATGVEIDYRNLNTN